MPFKHDAARRHHIPRSRRRVTNWPAYEAGLRRRGDLTFWLDEAALSGWSAPRQTTRGGQPRYTDMAIELVLTLRLVFHLALRQVEGLARSVLRLFGLDLSVPDHTTLSRRGRAFAARQPRAAKAASLRQHDPPPDIVIPPRASLVVNTNDAGTPTLRDRHVQFIAEKGRMAWQKATGYGRRSLVEIMIGRHKHIIGPKLRARSSDG